MVFPLVFALMTSKDKDLFTTLFSNLNKFVFDFFNFYLEIINDFEQTVDKCNS